LFKNSFFSIVNNTNELKKSKLSFKFISFIPLSVHESRLQFATSTILLKQTYLLLAWFKYSKTLLSSPQTTLFVLPQSCFILTLVKSPMAHKNWSKEQLKTTHFTFILTYPLLLNFTTKNVNSILFLFLNIKKDFLPIETNLFFLKSYIFVVYTNCLLNDLTLIK